MFFYHTLAQSSPPLGFRLVVTPPGLEENIDYSDIPPLTDEFFERSTLRIPADQAHNFVQLARDVKQWFQAQGEQYKTLINNVLRQYRENNKTQHIDRTFEKFDRQFPT
ncbi:BrnA antitoxin family protein [Microcoleus sp. MON2_D5]|uniref:BrnA antitoxin family protein n=1 Tax=Microcoleus sp. MON2_D5 TaxID=2818833 RepID=UPI002FD0A738